MKNDFDLRSAKLAELEALMLELNEPVYRASQIFLWVQRRGINSIDEMKDLPIGLRRRLEVACRLSSAEIIEKKYSLQDESVKYLFAFENNTIIESVLMQNTLGDTICVSSQAGCRMGCRFCASAKFGLQRSLTAGEMCAQVVLCARDSGKKINRIVMMGCGEPLDNYEECVRFISLAGEPKGLNIGQRRVTLSTCGLVDKINRLAEERLQINFAISLHAADDGVRRSLMPVANSCTVRELIEVCSSYANKTRRRVTYEYALIDGVNDGNDQARKLAGLLRGKMCHVNLIPVNEVYPEYKKSRRTAAFYKILAGAGINATVRNSMGGDIGAACGQLRGRRVSEGNI